LPNAKPVNPTAAVLYELERLIESRGESVAEAVLRLTRGRRITDEALYALIRREAGGGLGRDDH